MPDLVCVKCQRKLRVEKNGVNAIEFTPIHNKEGKFLRMEPYQIHDSDKWKCPGCGMEILAGFGQQPWAGEWIDNFAVTLKGIVSNPKIEYVNYTDFSKEDQKTIEKLLEQGVLTIIKVDKDEEDAAS